MRRLALADLPVPARVRDALALFLDRLPPQDRARIRRVILFGSVARGEEGPESDVDLLVVWEGRPYEALDRLIPASTGVLIETGIDLSVIPFDPQQMREITRMRTGFYENVEREGIVLV